MTYSSFPIIDYVFVFKLFVKYWLKFMAGLKINVFFFFFKMYDAM